MLVFVRIISGQFRSRSLDAPAGLDTRPTSDRLRETLFNVLAPRIEGCSFLDLYAGSGAVGLEALSRGAARAEFVERAPNALKALRGNLAGLGIRAGFHIDAGSVAAALKRLTKSGHAGFDVIFLDPPYDLEKDYESTLSALGGIAAGLVAANGVVIAEHRRKAKLAERFGRLQRRRLLEQGDAALSFYQLSEVGE
jgi:16S rRNA (guanine(966)-N(2))-methyltransferase RsmD